MSILTHIYQVVSNLNVGQVAHNLTKKWLN